MHGLGVSLLLFLASAPASAEGPARVVVVASGKTPALDAVAAEAEVLARGRVSEQSGLVVVHLTASTRPPRTVLSEAHELVHAGEAAYAELETRRAIRSLTRAVSLLEGELDTIGERELLLRALSLLASVHHQSGHRRKAERAFLKLLALSPSYALDERTFPPGDVVALESLREQLVSTPPATLEITSGGVPAGVWLDGEYRGITPLSLEDVEPGAHLWLVRRQGYLPARGTVSVEGKPASVRARLRAPPSDRGLPRRVQRLVVERMNLHPTLFALVDAIGEPDELIAIVVEEEPEGAPLLRVVRALVEDAVLVGYREIPLGEGWQERYAAALDELLAAPTTAESPAPAVASASDQGLDESPDGSALLWAAGAAGGVVLTAAVVTGVVVLVSFARANGGVDDPTDPHALARRRVVLGF